MKRLISPRIVAISIFLVAGSLVALSLFRCPSKVFDCNAATAWLRDHYVDFDVSMNADKLAQVSKKGWGGQFVGVFKQLYAKNNFRNVTPQEDVKIPKIIHQIWLGSPFPEKYRAWQKSWIDHHPDWEYKLWTEKELNALTMINRDLYDKARNYGEKSDIAYYEILYQFGGMCIDTDFECLHSFDVLHHTYDFYIGMQPIDAEFIQVGCGLIGAVPGHQIMKDCIERIRANKSPQIIAKTGPLHLTQSCALSIARGAPGINIVLPATYLYPCGYFQKGLPREQWDKHEALAVHHWEGSWLEPQAFERQG